MIQRCKQRIFMEAIILFSAIVDHEEKTVSYKNSLRVFANHRNENPPIIGMKLRQSSECDCYSAYTCIFQRK